MPGESKTSPRRLVALQKQMQALELRMAGATLDQIAQKLGYTHRAGAYQAVMAALRKVPEPRVNEIRTLNMERLNKARLAIWTNVIKGDIKSIDTEIKIQERESRYLGLDAPTKHELTGEGGGPVEVEVGFDDLKRKLDSIAARVRAPGLPAKPDA